MRHTATPQTARRAGHTMQNPMSLRPLTAIAVVVSLSRGGLLTPAHASAAVFTPPEPSNPSDKAPRIVNGEYRHIYAAAELFPSHRKWAQREKLVRQAIKSYRRRLQNHRSLAERSEAGSDERVRLALLAHADAAALQELNALAARIRWYNSIKDVTTYVCLRGRYATKPAVRWIENELRRGARPLGKGVFLGQGLSRVSSRPAGECRPVPVRSTRNLWT